jgi:hypothetical protein
MTMKTSMYKIIIGLMWLVLPTGCFGQQVPTAKITVQVTDDGGDPVPGAFIGVGGGGLTPENGPVPGHRNGTTDGKGRFIAEIASAMDQYGAFARKDGYYEGKAYYYSKKTLMKNG